jgi:peptidoglycan/xylan/chitin deacetylase (PgdA/CDA1 family)
MMVAGVGFVAGILVGAGRGPGGAGQEVAAAAYAEGVPILMYHAIADPPPDTSYPELFVSPRDFDRQMDDLAARGFDAVTLDELAAAWRGRAPMPANPIVITFDDGLRSQYAEAMPKFEELGWAGVLNLKIEALDQGEMTDEMVEEMIAAGWEIGSHTVSHANVSKLGGAELEAEVAGSRDTLRERFDVPVRFFCYPAGAFDRRAVAAVRDAGYTGATTTKPGLAFADHPYTLDRIRVDGSDGRRGLAEKLRTAMEDRG